jgi:hypothetical protein
MLADGSAVVRRQLEHGVHALEDPGDVHRHARDQGAHGVGREQVAEADDRGADDRRALRGGELTVGLLRSLLKAEPTLEDVVRDLYRRHGELGDLNGLIREERQLRQALREPHHDPNDPAEDARSYRPEPKTVAVYNEVRTRLDGASKELGGLSAAGV